MTRVRVAITGIGTICAIGRDTAAFTDALRRGDRGFSRIDDPRLRGLRVTHAALVRGFEPDPAAPEEIGGLDRHVHLALCALREALGGAGLSAGLGARGGVVLGTCSGGMLSIERHYEALARGEDPVDARLLFSKRYYTAAKVLAWAAGARGPALTVVTACAAGTGAIAQAADLIRAGYADVVAAGGADAFAPSTLAGFDALKATAEGMCAPFSQPVGLNLGEGAAFLVLERYDRAVGRAAPILAELLGTGLSNDAYHPTAPDPTARGQMAAMQAALADAGITAAQIDYINAHGTGTRANDPAESRAISRLLGERAARVPVSSTKSMIGHCLGGAGALEASATVLAARAGFLPPTAGFAGRREGCDLDCVPDAGRRFAGRIALSNSFGFAGNNACVVLDTAPCADEGFGAAARPAGDVAVVTGCSAITPFGVGTRALAGGASAIADVARFEAPVRPFPAGLVPPVDAREVDRRLDLKGMDPCSRYAALAARAALDAAALKPRPRATSEVGLVLGIATGPGQGEAEHLEAVFRGDFVLQHLGAFPYVVPNEVAGNVARALLLRGHSTVIAAGQGAGLAACASSAIAVALGHVEAIVAAAADELTPRSVADGYKVGQLGPGTRVVPGEGAAAFVLESRKAAAERGAAPLAEVRGAALVTEGSSPCAGDRAAACLRAAEEALSRAGIAPGDVTALVAGSAATGAPEEEIRALAGLFGGRLAAGDLAARIGFAEAALPLIELAVAIELAAPDEIVLAAWASPEGFGSAVVLRRLPNF
ncbi:MAG: beta-ketoacyl-[acyl-carrier-protein] synthase family protein [Proteobacteria bacterium]|nr:beta-ketoacyl-[acyl-carrier-protein] synthase family protein [Pseudomonadota bacterium]